MNKTETLVLPTRAYLRNCYCIIYISYIHQNSYVLSKFRPAEIVVLEENATKEYL